jgi:hypothetical protein
MFYWIEDDYIKNFDFGCILTLGCNVPVSGEVHCKQ